MRILGIDPGTKESAFLLFDSEVAKFEVFGKVPNEDLLKIVQCGFSVCDMVAVEHIQSFGMAVGKTVFETAYMIGRIQQACFERGIPFRRVYRKEVCVHHCHSAKAKDANIRAAMIDNFGEPGTKKNPGGTYGISKDVWSALAIASYAWETRNEVS